MSDSKLTSLERVLTTIGHQEPDRVPLFLLLATYGAKELNMSVKDYFSSADNVVRAQLLMREKYNTDCLYTFFYAPIEIEAWGGEVIFVEDGPPNSGNPFIQSIQQIDTLTVPKIKEIPALMRVLETTQKLKEKVGQEVPIIGVVVSPFSLPVMQMGFEKYLEILYFREEYFEKLMKINEAFCQEWANAQLEAGATAICYFNPLASPTIIERSLYLKTGYPVDVRTLSGIKGPTATHLASGITLPVIEDLAKTGTAIIGFSAKDDLETIKAMSQNKLCLLGNLNGIEMIHWDEQQVEKHIKDILSKAGVGGGLILSDNHGEIPWQVSEQTLLHIAKAVQKWGNYPLKWTCQDA